MVDTALKDARKNIPIIKVKNSSKQAFIECLDKIDSCNKDCKSCKYKNNNSLNVEKYTNKEYFK